MTLSHSGFFLFHHYNLFGYFLQTVNQPLTETTGLLISWACSFLPRTISTTSDEQGGGLLSDHPHGHNHSDSLFKDWYWFLKTHPRVRIVTYSLRTGTRSKCLQDPWVVILTMEPNHHQRLQDAVGVFLFTTTKCPRVLHTRVQNFPDHNIKSLLFPRQPKKTESIFPKKHTHRQKVVPPHQQVATWTTHTLAENQIY